jgi:hypothetical protein
MTEGEAAADVLTGAIVAHTVEPQTGAAAQHPTTETRAPCLNCGAALSGSYCAACGQAAHIHRSITSIAHDILHSVVHFDGKLWRTLPELAIRPGRLTRRYIEGERAKFVSPMALYLFSVFLMYALFSLTGGVVLKNDWASIPTAEDSAAGIAALDVSLQNRRAELGEAGLSAAQRVELTEEIADLETSRAVMVALASGDLARVEEIERAAAARRGEAEEPERTPTELESTLSRRFEEISDSPGLFVYKLQTNGYKFLWVLVPLSIPFVWLLFCWRRDVRAYDHAVFVTYSMSFMLLLLVFVSLLGTVGIRSGFITAALFVIPPIHMYKQLRAAYGLSRPGAVVRLFFLLIAAAIVLLVYLLLLLLLGVLG